MRGEYLQFYLNPQTSIRDAEGFRQLVVRRDAGSIVRLGDVARVELGAQNYDWHVSDNGTGAVFIALGAAISANPLEVGERVRRSFRGSSRNCPMA